MTIPKGLPYKDETEVRELIDEIWRRFEPTREQFQKRKAMFFNLEESFDPLPAPYTGSTFMGDRPRKIHSQLRARLTENDVRFVATGTDQDEDDRNKADDLETVVSRGQQIVQERSQLSFQESLADGQIITGYNFLHWRTQEDIWPKIPEEDIVDKGKAPPRKTKTKTTRRSIEQAKAGYPWFEEVIEGDKIAYVEDRNLKNGFGIIIYRREVPLLQYRESLMERGLTLRQRDEDMPVDEEVAQPDPGMPSVDHYGTSVVIWELWTRSHWIEAVQGEVGKEAWEVVAGDMHPYEMPPFAICPGNSYAVDDPKLKYMPVLEGVYKMKKYADRFTALFMIIAEMIAMPVYYLEDAQTGIPHIDDKGKAITFTRNSMAALKLPTGTKMAQLPYELNPAFIEALTLMRELEADAAPSTGEAGEISATTAPWALRLQIQQANVEPSSLLKSAVRTFNIKVRNQTMVMSKPPQDGGFAEPVAVFAKTKDGVIIPSETISIDPGDIPSLDIQAFIDPTSATERIAKTEHLRDMLNDPMAPIDQRYFIEEGLGIQDAAEFEARYKASVIFEQYIYPNEVVALLMEEFGPRAVLGPNMEFSNMNGEPITPQQGLEAKGIAAPSGAPSSMASPETSQQPLADNAPQGQFAQQPPLRPGG